MELIQRFETVHLREVLEQLEVADRWKQIQVIERIVNAELTDGVEPIEQMKLIWQVEEMEHREQI